MKGIGFAGLVLSSWFAIYYVVILAWALFYFLHSVSGHSPWSSCDNSFNSDCCSSEYNVNGTLIVPDACNSTAQLPESEFWFKRALNVSSGFEEIGSLRLELLGCLVIMWVLIFICVFKGIKSTGKSAYVTGMVENKSRGLQNSDIFNNKKPHYPLSCFCSSWEMAFVFQERQSA